MQTENVNLLKSMSRPFQLFIIIFVVALILSSVFFVYALGNDKIYHGVTVNGIDVGGLTKTEAAGVLKERINGKITNKLTLTANGQSWIVSAARLDAEYNYQKAVEEAYQYGRDQGIIKQALLSAKLVKANTNIEICIKLNKQKTTQYVKTIAKQIDYPPLNANINVVGGRVIIEPEKAGLTLDQKLTASKLMAAFACKQATLALPVKTVKPEFLREYFKGVNGVVSSYSTKFNAGKVNRVQNIRVAAKAINNAVIKPGETFSFNHQTGSRISQVGYLEAPVIVNNKLVPGIAGGVCQVSTTLYNAALLANLDIVERSPHSLPVKYVPIGQDAAVSEGWKDLKFTNTTMTPIVIKAWVSGDRINVTLFGDKNEVSQYRIRITTSNLVTINPKISYVHDSTLPVGTKAVKEKPESGYTIDVYRLVYKNGQFVKKEKLSHSVYRPVKGVILVGTKKTSNTVRQSDSSRTNSDNDTGSGTNDQSGNNSSSQSSGSEGGANQV